MGLMLSEEEIKDSETIFTVPNLISVIRLIFIPVFLWLLIFENKIYLAAWLLAFLGVTDFLDGWLARRLGQVSKLGKILDPAADRLLLLSVVVGGIVSGVIPTWLIVIVGIREVLILLGALWLLIKKAPHIDVTKAGKLGTLLLMLSFPLFLVANSHAFWSQEAYFAARLISIPGIIISWYAAFGYIKILNSLTKRKLL